MNSPTSDNSRATPDDALDRAIRAVVVATSPEDVRRQSLDRIAQWPPSSLAAASDHRRWSPRRLVVATAAATLLVALGIAAGYQWGATTSARALAAASGESTGVAPDARELQERANDGELTSREDYSLYLKLPLGAERDPDVDSKPKRRERLAELPPPETRPSATLPLAAQAVPPTKLLAQVEAEALSRGGLSLSGIPGEARADGETSEFAPRATQHGLIRANVQFHVATQATVLVANGGREPLELGQYVPYQQARANLHVWKWRESTVSRIVPDVVLQVDDRIALSPDGTRLVWADGRTLDLRTLEKSSIDLGGSRHDFGETSAPRIRDLKFAPDGARLLLQLDEFSARPSEHPLRANELVVAPLVQSVSFPGGELLGKFAPAHSLPWVEFGASGKFAVTCDARQERPRVALRSATLERVEREFEPPLPSYAAALAVSPDDRLVAARAQSDTILVWNANTGALVKEIRHADLTRAGHRTLTFSPDGRKLAVALVEQACIIDVESGAIEGRLPQIAVARFAWSDGGEVLTTVSGFVHYERHAPPQLFNVYPAVQDWDWRTAKLLRDRSRPAPASTVPK